MMIKMQAHELGIFPTTPFAIGADGKESPLFSSFLAGFTNIGRGFRGLMKRQENEINRDLYPLEPGQVAPKGQGTSSDGGETLVE